MTRTVLTDGGFSCVDQFAVKVAHMMSCAQAAYDHGDEYDVWTILREYLDGKVSEDEVIQTLMSEWPEAFPGVVEGAHP